MCGFNIVYNALEMVYTNIFKGLMIVSIRNPKSFVEALKIIYHNPYKKLTLDSIINYKTFKKIYLRWWRMIYTIQILTDVILACKHN